jgi:hypothetical protein
MWLLPLLTILTTVRGEAADRPGVVIVVSAPGTPAYDSEFHAWADRWKAAAARGSARTDEIGSDSKSDGPTDRDRLKTVLAEQAATAGEPLWLILIGHGTFDGKEAKFNLRGPDVSDQELANWLEPAKRPLVLIDCTSASAPFLNRLSGPNRVVITATRSGDEQNYARFGRYIAEAISDIKADLDKDGQVSALEAYLAAAHRVEDYYRTRSQLASEHALIDDNGDRLGTPPDWFRGVRATRRAKGGAAPDGVRAHQIHLIPSDRERRIPSAIRRHRDELELAVAALRGQKDKLGEEAYYSRLEPLMLELGRLYRQAESAGSKSEAPSN